jgi:magnesium transporter
MRIPVKSNDVKPFQYHSCGVVFKEEVCATISFHKTEMLTDLLVIPTKEY